MSFSMNKVDFIEYFENELHEQPKKVDNCNMCHREIVVLVGYRQNIDFIRNQLWQLCQGYESKLELEYSFNSSTKIFGIIKRDKEKICMTRIYLCIADKIGLIGLRPDVIVAYGTFFAEQCEVMFDFMQRSNKAGLEVEFFNR